MYNGVINVYKEPGYTSFDVIAKLRGILKQKKIGHTGTLDPDAEGVLVVCLGNATKLCDILTDKDKCYTATLLLGITTDTEDTSGTVISSTEVCVSEEEVMAAILSFVGEYEQIPPMYSALKVNGKKLYELAREGKVIERTPRQVSIYSLEVIHMELPRVVFRVSCGKGTYIRSLCRDIGEQLGCGGVMEHLVRDSVNSTETGKCFHMKDSLKLSEIENLVEKNTLDAHILSVDKMFPNLPKFQVTPSGQKKLQNGNFLQKQDLQIMEEKAPSNDKCLIYDLKGEFKAIYVFDIHSRVWKADKMFL